MTSSTFDGRGLLLQRLCEIIGALAQFIKQPRVLDGDDGLGGEVRDKLDLLLSERTDFLAVDGDETDQNIFPEHRDRKHGAIATKISAGD